MKLVHGAIVFPGKYRVHGDLVSTGGVGIRILAPFVTLDLGGHILSGRGLAGISARLGSHVTIRNGAIRGFKCGVFSRSAFTTVTDVDFTGCAESGAELCGYGSKFIGNRTNWIPGHGSAMSFFVAMRGRAGVVKDNSACNILCPSGEGAGIIAHKDCKIEGNLLSNERPRAKTIGIFTGQGGKCSVSRNKIDGFEIAVMGGGKSSAPVHLEKNEISIPPIQNAKAYSISYGTYDGNVIS